MCPTCMRPHYIEKLDNWLNNVLGIQIDNECADFTYIIPEKMSLSGSFPNNGLEALPGTKNQLYLEITGI